jgi:hypothetical protein
MSLQTRLSDLITRLGTEFKAIRILISGTATGGVGSLATTATNLVAAINEVKATADAASGGGGGGVTINDSSASTETVYSSTQTDLQISAAVSALVGSAPTALDTLNELAAALGDDANFASTVTTALAGKAATSEIYTRTELGDPETNLVNLFNTALT